MFLLEVHFQIAVVSAVGVVAPYTDVASTPMIQMGVSVALTNMKKQYSCSECSRSIVTVEINVGTIMLISVTDQSKP